MSTPPSPQRRRIVAEPTKPPPKPITNNTNVEPPLLNDWLKSVGKQNFEDIDYSFFILEDDYEVPINKARKSKVLEDADESMQPGGGKRAREESVRRITPTPAQPRPSVTGKRERKNFDTKITLVNEKVRQIYDSSKDEDVFAYMTNGHIRAIRNGDLSQIDAVVSDVPGAISNDTISMVLESAEEMLSVTDAKSLKWICSPNVRLLIVYDESSMDDMKSVVVFSVANGVTKTLAFEPRALGVEKIQINSKYQLLVGCKKSVYYCDNVVTSDFIKILYPFKGKELKPSVTIAATFENSDESKVFVVEKDANLDAVVKVYKNRTFSGVRTVKFEETGNYKIVDLSVKNSVICFLVTNSSNVTNLHTLETSIMIANPKLIRADIGGLGGGSQRVMRCHANSSFAFIYEVGSDTIYSIAYSEEVGDVNPSSAQRPRLVESFFVPSQKCIQPIENRDVKWILELDDLMRRQIEIEFVLLDLPLRKISAKTILTKTQLEKKKAGDLVKCSWNALDEPGFVDTLLENSAHCLLSVLLYTALRFAATKRNGDVSALSLYAMRILEHFVALKEVSDKYDHSFRMIRPFLNLCLSPNEKRNFIESKSDYNVKMRKFLLESGVLVYRNEYGAAVSPFGDGEFTSVDATALKVYRNKGIREEERFTRAYEEIEENRSRAPDIRVADVYTPEME